MLGNEKDRLRSYPSHLILMIAEAFIEERRTGITMDPEKRDRCYYHDHRDEADKCQL